MIVHPLLRLHERRAGTKVEGTWYISSMVDGRNPAKQLICKIRQYLQGFILVRSGCQNQKTPLKGLMGGAKWMVMVSTGNEG